MANAFARSFRSTLFGKRVGEARRTCLSNGFRLSASGFGLCGVKAFRRCGPQIDGIGRWALGLRICVETLGRCGVISHVNQRVAEVQSCTELQMRSAALNVSLPDSRLIFDPHAST